MEDASGVVLDLYYDLKMKFDDFYFQDEFTFCLFLVTAQEKRLVDALYHYENSERKTTRSLFLRFSTPFIDREDYLETVLEELKYIVAKAEEEYFKPNEIGLDISLPEHLDSFEELMEITQSFASNFSTLPDELCIYVDPMAVSDSEDWSELLGEFLKASTEFDIKLFTCFLKTKPDLSTDYLDGDQVWILEPNLNFSEVTSKIAESGDQSDPQVAFRSAFTKMTISAQKEHWDKAEEAAENALSIAQSEGWEHLEISIYLSIASFNLSNSMEDQAIENYSKAVSMSKSMSDEDKDLILTMRYQSLMSRAGALMKIKMMEEARNDYDVAQELLLGAEHIILQRMEALRMKGFCDFALGDEESGLEAYLNAIQCAKKADAQALPHTTLPIIGSDTIKAAKRMGDLNLVAEVEEEMELLLGDDWYSLASNMNTL